MKIRLKYLCYASFVVLSRLLLACAGDIPVSSANNLNQKPTAISTREAMIIEGRIVDVMESWPLQLTVQTENGLYHVALLSETRIAQQGQRVDPGKLTSGLRVRIEGQASGTSPLAMSAQSLEIE